MRILVLLLLLANLGFAAWTQGWLDNLVGIRAAGDREPERLLRQVRPETVVIVSAGAAASSASAEPATTTAAASASPAASGPASAAGGSSAAAPTECLEAGPFDAVQVAAAEKALRSLDPPLESGSWTHETVDRPGEWLVYMGRYAGSAPLEKKEEELKRRNLDYEEVHLPGLEPGLSLGRFADKAAANAALTGFASQGIRTARVVKAREAATAHLLRFEQAEPALGARLAGLQGNRIFGSGFAACAAVKPSGN